jgi:hypothetical protein
LKRSKADKVFAELQKLSNAAAKFFAEEAHVAMETRGQFNALLAEGGHPGLPMISLPSTLYVIWSPGIRRTSSVGLNGMHIPTIRVAMQERQRQRLTEEILA